MTRSLLFTQDAEIRNGQGMNEGIPLFQRAKELQRDRDGLTLESQSYWNGLLRQKRATLLGVISRLENPVSV